MISNRLKDNQFVLMISVIAILIFRLVLTAAVPLLDKTEARYAEISRIMYETKEWVVLQTDYGFPFWAKPPLSTWMSAVGFMIFGINEFASRFPSFLLSVIILIIAGRFVKKAGASFYLPGFILLTMPEFLIHTGVVSTDSALSFAVTLMMLSFWKMMDNTQKTYWNYLFFASLGLGLLAKGPLILVLAFPPLFLWCCLDLNRFKELFSSLPIVLGTLITIAVALPWYYLMEQRSPGFTDYFIVGEHFKRFVEPGWKGDLYGRPKTQPTGMIWAFLMAFCFPWFQIVLYKLWKNRTSVFKDRWVSFLFLWLFWLPVFFTFSKNIMHTYTLPSTVPLMFLMVHYWKEYNSKKALLRAGLFFPVAAFVAYVVLMSVPTLVKPNLNYNMNSDKYMLENLKVTTENKNIPLYYWKEKNYSGQFYSHGKAQLLKDIHGLDSVMGINKVMFFAIAKEYEADIPQQYKDRMTLAEENYKTAIYKTK